MTEDTQARGVDVAGLFSESWNLFTENVGLLIAVYAVAGLILMAANYVTHNWAQLVIGGPLTYGLAVLLLAIARKQPADFNMLFAGFQRFVPTFLAGLVISVLTVVGLILLILPGLFVTMIYMLTYFYIKDRDLDFWPAMEASRLTVMNNLGQWFVIWLVAFALIVAGIIALGVGVLVTGPIAGLFVTLAYTRLAGEPVIETTAEPMAE